MTSYYQWLTKLEVVTLHNAIIRDYGGHSNILDEGALESTLHRPQNLVYYQPDSTVFDLAAAYGYGIVKNHCFLDGNKRTAFVVMTIFLLKNRVELIADELEAVEIMVNIAKGEISQSELAIWLSNNVIILD